jgi:hypothetical protein
MVGELADAEAPSLDWDRTEAALFARLDAGGLDVPGSDAGRFDVSAATHANAREPLDTSEMLADDADKLASDLTSTIDRPSLPMVMDVADGAFSEARLVRESLVDVESLEAPAPGARRASAPRTFTRGAVAFVAALAVAAGVMLGFGIGSSTPLAPVAVAEPVDLERVALAPGYGERPASGPGSSMPAGVDDVHDLGALKTGDVVEASTGPVAFGRFGVLTWTLAPGGRLIVRSTAEPSRHVVVLESGSLRGEVGDDETLIVEVGETEVVASAGGVFSVTRSSRGLFVDVAQGKASIGALGGYSSGLGEHHVLEAPHRGKFSSDGAHDFELVPDAVAARDPRGATSANATGDGARGAAQANASQSDAGRAGDAASHRTLAVEQPAAVGAAAKAPGATRSDVEAATPAAEPAVAFLSEGAAKAKLMRCLADARAAHGATNDGVSVSVVSTLRVSVDDSGAVKGASFSPPLLPEYQSCAVFLFHERLDPAKPTVSIPVELH